LGCGCLSPAPSPRPDPPPDPDPAPAPSPLPDPAPLPLSPPVPLPDPGPVPLPDPVPLPGTPPTGVPPPGVPDRSPPELRAPRSTGPPPPPPPPPGFASGISAGVGLGEAGLVAAVGGLGGSGRDCSGAGRDLGVALTLTAGSFGTTGTDACCVLAGCVSCDHSTRSTGDTMTGAALSNTWISSRPPSFAGSAGSRAAVSSARPCSASAAQNAQLRCLSPAVPFIGLPATAPVASSRSPCGPPRRVSPRPWPGSRPRAEDRHRR